MLGLRGGHDISKDRGANSGSTTSRDAYALYSFGSFTISEGKEDGDGTRVQGSKFQAIFLEVRQQEEGERTNARGGRGGRVNSRRHWKL